MYYSQSGQDKWVIETLKKTGFFVDVGAYDGIQTSNTYALEKLGWEGICIEANPDVFKTLEQNRECKCINQAVTNQPGNILFTTDRITLNSGTPVYGNTLDNILKTWEAPKVIDYLSIDIEGHEYEALKNFPFNEYQFKLITIEHNLYCDGPKNKELLFNLLSSNGYTRVREDVKCLDPNPAYFMQPYEDWYINENI
jgi:FkbM family methyltransferase